MSDIRCHIHLNQFLIKEPLFENTFKDIECEQRKFYGDCYHCFATAIIKRDKSFTVRKPCDGCALMQKVGNKLYKTYLCNVCSRSYLDMYCKKEDVVV